MTFPHDPTQHDPMAGPDPARQPTRRWIKILLFASLALNVAVAGLALGAVLRHDEARDDRRARYDRSSGPYTAALTRDDRRAIWQEMRSRRDADRPDWSQISADYDAVVAALRTEPFDSVLLRDIVTRQFDAGIARQQLGNTLLLEHIEAMDPQARAAFADRLSATLQEWRDARERRKSARDRSDSDSAD